MTLQNKKVFYALVLILIISVCAARVSVQQAGFSVSTILDAMPALQPIVQAGSNRCEGLKSYFGLTYEQLLEKKTTTIDDMITIDHITKKGNIKHHFNDTNNLKKLMRNARHVVILIHGFMESSDGLMVNRVAPEFLKKQYLKVFALDGRNVFTYEYFRSSTYSRFMGEKLGVFLSEVIKSGANPSKFTLVGHSLGAHIAGVAGKQVKRKTNELIGRITGLDPAGPCFSNVDLGGRLDKEDAEYVDVIHTNAGILGLNVPVGHKDYYPNNGMSQPGCFLSTCDHSRAWEMYSESINMPKHFPARKCDNWTAFKNGLCLKNEVTFMGIESQDAASGTYFLITGSSFPYGLGSAGSDDKIQLEHIPNLVQKIIVQSNNILKGL